MKRVSLFEILLKTSIILLFINESEEKFFCAPDLLNSSCKWNSFGWQIYHGCGYKQNLDRPSCMIKNLDGSRATLIIQMNLSFNEDFCFSFKYLITGKTQVFIDFYGKNLIKPRKTSDRFFTFRNSENQTELYWYSIMVQLPKNLTMLNMVTGTNGFASNYSIAVKDLLVQTCHRTNKIVDEIISNSTPIVEFRFNRKYLWFSLIFIIFLLFLVFFVVLLTKFNRRKKEKVVERIVSGASLNSSRHFYEEPVSVIFSSNLDMNCYDHVRDNYI